MPYVKHIPIHTGTHLKNSLKYIDNPEKASYVTGVNCPLDIDTSISLFDLYDDINKEIADNDKKPRIAHHYLQSFEPDAVSAEEAHRIGVELTKTIAPGYMCHVATHIDKEHIHNHIFIYAVHPETEYKYRHNDDQYKFAQEQSDAICLEKGIPIIEEPKKRGVDNKEFRAIERGGSWKDKLTWDIDDAIEKAVSENTGKEGFIKYLEDQGYIVKYQNKNISIKTSEHKAVRVDTLAKAFGEQYAKENIERRLKGEAAVEFEDDFLDTKQGDKLPKHLKYGDTSRFNEYNRYKYWCKNNNKKAIMETVKRDPPDLYFYKHKVSETTFDKFSKVDTENKEFIDEINREQKKATFAKFAKIETTIRGKPKSIREKLAWDIDDAIEKAVVDKTGKKGFIKYLEDQGYIVKYQNKNISINIPGRKAVRVDTLAKTYGNQYSKDNIEQRLKGNAEDYMRKSFPDIKVKTKLPAEIKYDDIKSNKSTKASRFNLFGNIRATSDRNKYRKTKDEYEIDKEMEDLGRVLGQVLRGRRYKAKSLKGNWKMKNLPSDVTSKKKEREKER